MRTRTLIAVPALALAVSLTGCTPGEPDVGPGPSQHQADRVNQAVNRINQGLTRMVAGFEGCPHPDADPERTRTCFIAAYSQSEFDSAAARFQQVVHDMHATIGKGSCRTAMERFRPALAAVRAEAKQIRDDAVTRDFSRLETEPPVLRRDWRQAVQAEDQMNKVCLIR